MEIPVIVVKARNLRSGDILCTQVDRPGIDQVAIGHSWRLQSDAVQDVMQFMLDNGRSHEFWDFYGMINEMCATVKQSEAGRFYVRIGMFSGGVVRIGRNSKVAVHRKKGVQ